MKPRGTKQLELLKKTSLAYGGALLKKRKGRAGGRPLSTRSSLHLVLRSSQAQGTQSFKAPKNRMAINRILKKFSIRHHVRILSMANVGNHLHLHLQLLRRDGYKPFIRAVTGAIAMAVTGRTRWTLPPGVPTLAKERNSEIKQRFWDYRPFTRVVQGFQAQLRLKDYIQINLWESYGLPRNEARARVNWRWSSSQLGRDFGSRLRQSSG